MTPFSSALEFYMKEKEIKTHSIAQFCGIDRSNMYKIISGKRNPASEKLVEKISEYMKLKPKERRYLMEAYRITVMGYDTYHRRKSVGDFLRAFSDGQRVRGERILLQDYMTMDIDEWELKLRQGIIVKNGQLKSLILSILSLELKKPESVISLVMQPEVADILDEMAMLDAGKKELVIEHIFCLSNSNAIMADKQDYNLMCLKNILPVFIHCSGNYKPYCYYDNIVSHNNCFNLLSSMVLTSEYAVVFSMEEKYGMLLTAKDTIRYLQELFQSLKEDAFLIANKMNSLEKQLKSFEKINLSDDGIGFHQEACLIPIIPPAFLEKYMSRTLLENRMVFENVLQYIGHIGKALEVTKATFLFTEGGVKRFLNNGRISELSESVYYPLEYSDRLVLIRRLMQECAKGRYRMLRGDAPIAECEICIYSSSQGGYLLLPVMHGDRIFLELQEAGILNAFRDYLEDTSDRYLYNIEETINILKRLVRKKPGRLSEK